MKYVPVFTKLTRNVVTKYWGSERKPIVNLGGPSWKLSSTGIIIVIMCLILSCEALTAPVDNNCLAKAEITVPDDRNKVALGFLSFDLDDTLFSIRETVHDANNAMIHQMNQYLLSDHDPCTVEEFFAISREIRLDLQHPVTYADLRKMTIRKQLGKRKQRHPDIEKAVHRAFDVWVRERHASAERNLFDDALSTLQYIKDVYPDTCIAAITNGLGNPLEMNCLAPYFDFCVSGEEEHIFPDRKPHGRIYEVALQRYRELYPHHHDVDRSTNQPHRVWCHVGDCLANDVGASAACGALAIWYAPNIDEAEVELSSSLVSDPAWSTATNKEITERMNLANIAKMKVAQKISRLSQLDNAIESLLATGSANSKSLVEIPSHNK